MIGNIEQANRDAEQEAYDRRARRYEEEAAALRENRRNRIIDPDSQAALDRGDRQRETGVYQTEAIEEIPVCSTTICGKDYYEDWSHDSNGLHSCKLKNGHTGKHECIGSDFCHMTWE